MLVTVTRSPPSCSAMLPQKFSAATTELLPPGPAWATPEAGAQPPRHAATRTGTTARPDRSLTLDTRPRLNESDSQYKIGWWRGSAPRPWLHRRHAEVPMVRWH